MTRFIHIDHSFTSFGGHEYDYAMNLLSSAESAGYSIVLATHRKFRNREGIPGHWHVCSPFPHSIVKKHDVSSAPQYQHRRRDLLHRLWSHWARWKSSRRHDSFERACGRMFREVGFEEGDQCFLATFSELDLPGLAQFLNRNPKSMRATWHIQFHFDFALDEPPDSEQRQALETEVRDRLRAFFALAGNHRVYFYCTTPALAELYSSLGIARFQYLPFPVNPRLETGARMEKGPLCVSIAGGSRREKGIHQLGATLAGAGRDASLREKIRFVGQMSLRHHRQLLRNLDQLSPESSIPFEKLPHPLPTAAYHQLLQTADIGLFLYDQSQYLRRCSGILQEMLATGNPVIVPAGCWLADQVAEPNYRYLEGLANSASQQFTLPSADAPWKQESSGQRIEWTRPVSDSEQILISVRPGKDRRDRDLCGRVEQLPNSGTSRHVRTFRLPRQSASGWLHLLVSPIPDSQIFSLFLENDSCGSDPSTDEIKVSVLDTTGRGPHPLGSIGLIADDERQNTSLLRDIVEHYEHYFTSSQQHAKQWRKDHHPQRSIEVFQGNSHSSTHHSSGAAACRNVNDVPAKPNDHDHPNQQEPSKTGTMEKLTVMIPCCNEEATIGACIESVLPFADEILVADSGSTDRTIEVIESYPECRLIRHTWNGYCHFKNWALERASHDWVFCLDADERVTPELADEICEILKHPSDEIMGYSVAFQTYFLGHRVRYSNWNNRSLRLIRRECRFRVCRVHESVDISKDQTGRLKHPVLHYSIHSYDQFFDKYAKYSKLAAEDMHTIGRRASLYSMLIRPFLRFFYLYIVRGGFLDGIVGIQIAMFMSFYYSFAKQARLWEMEHALPEPNLRTPETLKIPTSEPHNSGKEAA